jgi:hypothetical protein
MADKGVRIRIVSESVGKGFKDANKALAGLKKGVGLLGVSLTAASFVKFGKDSVKAFADNEKSAKRLAIVVKNLGQSFETPFIEQNLDRISAKFGYQGEVLRDAYQKLITATGSAAKSNELLNLSLDVAAGSTVDLVTVNADLAASYLGNNKGLSKYGLGLSKAQLKTLKFDDAVTLLSKNFKGAAGDELTTYEGKMRVLGEAAGNAQEIIGKSLVDSLTILSGEGNTIQPLADAMGELATYTGEVITGLATMIAEFKKLPGVEKYLTDIYPFLLEQSIPGQLLEVVRGFGKKEPVRMGGYPSSALGPGYIDPNEAKRKAVEAERLKREKERLALEKKGALEAKKRAALEKAARTLELERINLTAALKGKISETDRLSLNLQLALLDKNDTAATKLSGELAAAVKNNALLQAALLATPEAPNPYRNWKVPDVGPLGGLSAGVIAGVNPSAPSMPSIPVVPQPPSFNVPQYAPDSLTQYGPLGGLAAGVIAGVNMQPGVNVVVTLDGQELTSIITDTQINNSLSGSFNQVNRGQGFKGAVAT